ncbi:ABC transporter ATP-binding protein [Winogradskyella sp. F6397]|uniref:ABC transporter ATP-binding protein n=1 Tax=Winogradskyella marina TaxID=2785530 RepID=A0ABS0EQD3_9FLAO|nr:ABC transporter ATP-binding protein [Winogradskyella marina]MBF8150971.1 ABC transporter ATP-binding protein [Winogradskyella marina]
MSDKNEIVADGAVLVKVEGLSKKFCKDLKTSLWYGLKDLVSGVSGSTEDRLLRPKEFWAVKDISFELRRGECLGLIGHNGAGKSTLLKILNGLINPDAGKVTMKGRIGALIELGAGFNPILSGRENIYNNGAILGFSRKEIDSKLEAIIAFAELEDFIDMPVQHYSSGMKVRLGFAVAAQMEPDVLIIDEVLAVGDLGFILKCFKTIDTILPHTAVIFVSHSMPMISRICSQIVLMDRGESKFQGGDVGKAIDLYYNRFAINESSVVYTDSCIELNHSAVLAEKYEKNIAQLPWREKLEFLFEFNILAPIKDYEFFIIIIDKEQRPVARFKQNNFDLSPKSNSSVISFKASHNDLQLSKGVYSVNLAVRERMSKNPVYRINGILPFQITDKDETWEPFLLTSSFESISN